MGWLYMQSLKGYSGPRQYLDAQFAFIRPELTSKVLRSALVGMRVYYAAIEHVRTRKTNARSLPQSASFITTRAIWKATSLDIKAAARRAISRKPSPRPGQTIEQPLLFSDGRCLDRFEVFADPRNHRINHALFEVGQVIPAPFELESEFGTI